MRWAPPALDAARFTMEMAWLAVTGALLASLFGASGSPVPLWLALTVGAIGFTVMRFFVPPDAPLGFIRGFTVATGAVAVYVAVALLPGVDIDFAWPSRLARDWLAARHVIVGGVLVALFWWRGARLGQDEVWIYSLAQSFRIGIVVIVVGAIAHILLPVSLGATAATFLFFGAGIAGFALAHITSMAPEESAGLRDWPRTAALAVGGIVLGSAMLGVAAEGELGRVAATAFQWLLWALRPAALVLGWAIGLLIEALTYAMLWLAAAIRGDGPPVTFNPTFPNFGNVEQDPNGASFLPYWVVRFLGWFAALLVLSGVSYLLWQTLGARARNRYRGQGEERERVERDGSLGEDLSVALGGLLGRWGRRRQPNGPLTADLDPADPQAAALGAYRGLLALAADQGASRPEWETPLEFEDDLERIFPPEHVRLLTDAFVRTRYGAIPPSPEEVARIHSAWQALRQGGREE